MVGTTPLPCHPISLTNAYHTQGKYTIFGRVIDGAEDTLTVMERVPVNAKNRPLEEVRLEKVRCIFCILPPFGWRVRDDVC